MNITFSRAVAAVATAAVTATLALTPTAAQAATSSQADAASSWLADQLPPGTFVQTSGYPDYGLTLDFALAFLGTGTQTAAVDEVLDALGADPTVYTTGDGYAEYGEREDSQYAGATGKLAMAVQLDGRDATSVGGADLIAELERVVIDDGDEAGRASDISEFGDNSNAIGQSFVVRALAADDNPELSAATGYLLKQQCDTGEFRINMYKSGSVDRECGATDKSDAVSVDTTAFALEALIAARDAGDVAAIAGIDRAVTWLTDAQEDNGSYFDTGFYNSNSTGLAAAALAAAGESAAATRAANWVARLQAAACTPKMTDEVGAIAYDRDGFIKAQSEGITVNSADQFRRATAQAAIGLQYSTPDGPDAEPGPVAAMKLDLSTPKPIQNDTISITAVGTDAQCRSAGDVSDELSLESSVESDSVEDNTVTFNHASPHTITATHVPTGTTASITVEVSPAAVDTPSSGTDTDVVSVSDSGTTGADVNGTLPDTGATLQTWQLLAAAGLVVVGAVLVVEGRRRKTVVRSHVRR